MPSSWPPRSGTITLSIPSLPLPKRASSPFVKLGCGGEIVVSFMCVLSNINGTENRIFFIRASRTDLHTIWKRSHPAVSLSALCGSQVGSGRLGSGDFIFLFFCAPVEGRWRQTKGAFAGRPSLWHLVRIGQQREDRTTRTEAIYRIGSAPQNEETEQRNNIVAQRKNRSKGVCGVRPFEPGQPRLQRPVAVHAVSLDDAARGRQGISWPPSELCATGCRTGFSWHRGRRTFGDLFWLDFISGGGLQMFDLCRGRQNSGVREYKIFFELTSKRGR